MKFNWGHGLLATIIISSLGFIYLVVLSSREQVELVTEEYYPKGLVHDEEIAKMRNSRDLATNITIKDTANALRVTFPANISEPERIRGSIWIYYASDKEQDKYIDVKLDSGYNQYIKKNQLKKGRAELIIDWQADTTQFLFKEPVFVN